MFLLRFFFSTFNVLKSASERIKRPSATYVTMHNHGKGQMENYFVTLELTFRVFNEVKYLILYSIEAKTEHTLRTRLSQRHHHQFCSQLLVHLAYIVW